MPVTGSSVRPKAPPQQGDRGRHRVLRVFLTAALGLSAALVAGSVGPAGANAPDQSTPEMVGRGPGVVYLTFDDGPDELFFY